MRSIFVGVFLLCFLSSPLLAQSRSGPAKRGGLPATPVVSGRGALPPRVPQLGTLQQEMRQAHLAGQQDRALAIWARIKARAPGMAEPPWLKGAVIPHPTPTLSRDQLVEKARRNPTAEIKGRLREYLAMQPHDQDARDALLLLEIRTGDTATVQQLIKTETSETSQPWKIVLVFLLGGMVVWQARELIMDFFRTRAPREGTGVHNDAPPRGK